MLVGAAIFILPQTIFRTLHKQQHLPKLATERRKKIPLMSHAHTKKTKQTTFWREKLVYKKRPYVRVLFLKIFDISLTGLKGLMY